jgi:polysaccharide export outer membrane protein
MRISLLPGAPLLFALAACAHPGAFVWVDRYQEPERAGDHQYLIAAGDQLSVRVYNQDGMSARVRVRSDGQITLPFVGDVEAAGLAPATLSVKLQARLKEFVVNPSVTVSLETPQAIEVYVVGEVARPGRYPVEPRSSLLQALAAAGGLNGFAGRDRIYVIRREPAPVRIRFSLEALTHLEGQAPAFRLRGGDTIVVE